jgi:hypothetical protein
MSRSRNITIALLAAVLLVVFTLSVSAGKEDAPGWSVAAKDADLGYFYEGKDIDYDFTVRNTGDGELHILSVRPG